MAIDAFLDALGGALEESGPAVVEQGGDAFLDALGGLELPEFPQTIPDIAPSAPAVAPEQPLAIPDVGAPDANLSFQMTAPTAGLPEEGFGFQGEGDSPEARAPVQVPENVVAPIRKSLSKFVDSLPEEAIGQKLAFGAAETAVEFTTGFLASIPAGLAGLHEAIKTGDKEKATEMVATIQEAFTAEVQTKTGRHVKELADVPFEKYNEFVDTLVESGDLVGGFSPEEEPAANALMSAVLKGPALLLLLGAAPKAAKATVKAVKDKIPAKKPADTFPAEIPEFAELKKQLDNPKIDPEDIIVEKRPEFKDESRIEQLERQAEETIVVPDKPADLIVKRDVLPEKTEPSDVVKTNKFEFETKTQDESIANENKAEAANDYTREIKKVGAEKRRLEKQRNRKPAPDLEVKIEDAQETIDFLEKEKSKAETPEKKIKFETDKQTNEQQGVLLDVPREVKKGADLIVKRDVLPNKTERMSVSKSEKEPPSDIVKRKAAPEFSKKLDIKVDGETKVFRGHGRENINDVIAGGEAGPILGREGKYYSFDKETAKEFGPEIETVNLSESIKNPLIIKNTADFKRLANESGTTSDISQFRYRKNADRLEQNPDFPADFKRDFVEKITKKLKEKGHDSVIIDFDPFRDSDRLGNTTKQLRKQFGDPQVFIFDKPKAKETPSVKFETDKQTNEQQGVLLDVPREVKKGEEVGDLFDVELEATKEPAPKRSEIVELAKDAPIVTKKRLSKAQEAARVKVLRLDVEKDSMITAVEKMGGFDKQEIIDQFGYDPKDIGGINRKGLFGRPAFRPKDGRKLDDIGEALAEEGFLTRDENGKFDIRELEEKLGEELGGNKQFSSKKSVDNDALGNESEAFQRERDALRDEMADTAKPDGIAEALKAESDLRHKAEKRRPKGSTTLNMGVPTEHIGNFVKKAGERLRDSLGIAEKGVLVDVKEPAGETLGVLSDVKPPHRLAERVPSLLPIIEAGEATVAAKNRLGDLFTKRLNVVDRHLREIPMRAGLLEKAITKLSAEKQKQYFDNQNVFNELIVTGDLQRKVHTSAELKEAGVRPRVAIAYKLHRSLLNTQLRILNKARAEVGLDPLEGLKGYTPHVFDKYLVIVDKQIVTTGKTPADAIAAGNKIKRDTGKPVKVTFHAVEFPGQSQRAVSLSDAAYFKMRDQLEKDFTFSLEEAQEVMNGIAKRTNKKRFFGHSMERRNVPGWEKNVVKAAQSYANGLADYAASTFFKKKAISLYERQHGGKFSDDPASVSKGNKNVARYKKDYINDVLGVPRTGSFSETYFNELFAAVDKTHIFNGAIHKHLGDRPAAKLAQMEGKWSAVTKLGLYNTGSALVNLTQSMNTNAIIGPKYTSLGAKKALSGQDRGVLRALGVSEQLGLEAGAGIDGISAMGGAFKASMTLFSKAEYFNRSTAGLGAYHKFMDGKTKESKGKFKNEKERHHAALKFAEEVIDKSQFNYSVAGAPNLFRATEGTPLAIALRFQKFPVNQVTFITGLKGAEHARFWFPAIAVSGYYAFPGLDALDSMVNGMFGYSPLKKFDRFMIEWAGTDPLKVAVKDQIRYGLPGHGGVDLSGRIGTGKIDFPRNFKSFTGPFGGDVEAVSRQLTGKQHWHDTLNQMIPASKTVTTPLLALENDGWITSPYDRGRGKIKATTKDLIIKSAGGITTKESDASTFSNIMADDKKKEREGKAQGIDLFIESLDTGDEETRENALEQIREHGGVTKEMIMEEILKKKMPKLKRKFLFSLSKKGRAKNADLFRALNARQ